MEVVILSLRLIENATGFLWHGGVRHRSHILREGGGGGEGGHSLYLEVPQILLDKSFDGLGNKRLQLLGCANQSIPEIS